MSLTQFELEGLRLLGYSHRESEFLFLVATHSGYFTNHQFKTFHGTDSGSVSYAFIRKLLERRHSSYRAYRSGERVYHLFGWKVYQAIGRENLGTRKRHELEYIKTHLVALDFVLANRRHHYLETEGQRVRFFEKEYGLNRAVFPVKLYRARNTAGVAARYFVDRFPLFIDHQSGSMTFTYIDSGAVTVDGFRTHLKSYSALFQSLPAFDFVYVTPTKRLFEAAEREFGRIVLGQRSSGKFASLLDYFRIRRAWDAQERVTSADVVLLKEAQGRYAAKPHEELYALWLNGSANDAAVMEAMQQMENASRGIFRTLLCGESLKVFREPHRNSPGSPEKQNMAVTPKVELEQETKVVSAGLDEEAHARTTTKPVPSAP